MDIVDKREHEAVQVSLYSIIINIILSSVKFAAGIIGNSQAMISDAIHSASDVFATFIVIAGIKVSSRAEDEDHPYGHERLECVASLVLAVILGLTGLGIGYEGVIKVLHAGSITIEIPTIFPLMAAVLSIVVKEAMFWYTRAIAIKINSDAVMADAWHHRSDSFSSIGSFVGILGARLGYPILDPVASIVICLMIIYSAYSIFKKAIDKMVDHGCDEATTAKMSEMIAKINGVEHIDKLQTRMFGNRIFVDVEVSAADELTLVQAHHIAEVIHVTIEKNFGLVKHCMVHINPLSEKTHDY
jgi:cation diffusion facilitator family transporter